MFKSAVLCAVLAMGSVGAASAATVSFDGASNGPSTPYTSGVFSFDVARIVSGNCGVSKPCLTLNDNETTTITRIGGGTFSLVSLWFEILGRGTNNALTITATTSGTVLNYLESAFPHNNGGQVLSFLGALDNVTSVTFSTAANGGNVHIDDLNLVPSQVPVPAAAGLMALALGGLGLAGRRKKA